MHMFSAFSVCLHHFRVLTMSSVLVFCSCFLGRLLTSNVGMPMSVSFDTVGLAGLWHGS